MNPFSTLIVGAALMSSAVHPIQVPQIKRNSERVVEWFGTASGLQTFGCNNASIGYIDGFLSRQAGALVGDDKTRDRVVTLIGSFIGQCVVQVYGGRWITGDAGLEVEVKKGAWTHQVDPFDKVAKRLRDGEAEALLPYYRDLMTTVFNDLPQDVEPQEAAVAN